MWSRERQNAASDNDRSGEGGIGLVERPVSNYTYTGRGGQRGEKGAVSWRRPKEVSKRWIRKGAGLICGGGLEEGQEIHRAGQM